MSQMSSSGSAVPNPAPQAAEQASRVARYDKDPALVKPNMEGWDKIMDSDPRAKEAMKSLFESQWLKPGTGLGTPTWSPRAGAEREQRRKMAQGASADERMKILTDAGVTDREGMTRVFNRAYARPNRAFMMAKGR